MDPCSTGSNSHSVRIPAHALIQPIFDTLTQQDLDLCEDVSVELCYDNGEVEITAKRGCHIIHDSSIEVIDELLAKIDSYGDLQVNIFLSIGMSFDVDAEYSMDKGVKHDVGCINASIVLPLNFLDLDDLERRKMFLLSRGLLAHELQHVVQRVIMGRRLRSAASHSVDAHASDSCEIEARVEEILATSESGELDSDNFKLALATYIDNYLGRNGLTKDSLVWERLRKKMFRSHMRHYGERLEK